MIQSVSVSVLDQWAGQELVPLPALSRALEDAGGPGLDRAGRDYAFKKGVITPAVRVRGQPTMVTWEDAILIVLASMFAAAAGIALVTAFRALQQTGATVVNGSITIPIGSLTGPAS